MSKVEIDQTGYAWFLRKVHERLGIDLSQYRPEQMHRRLEALRARADGASFFTLAGRMEQDPAFAEQVRDQLTVNVSEFFRDHEHFGRLAHDIMPRLGRGRLRVWSAGCSLGAEAYSVSMLALEAGVEVMVWATDIDPHSLEHARAGEYRRTDLRGIDEVRLARWFQPAGPDRYTVRPEVKRHVRVDRHDLLADPFPSGWDLILCRNVVIYFTLEARTALFARFRDSLRVGGFLFTGASESVPSAQSLHLELVAPFFYQRSA